jgi:ParB-like chromosome segregation protein Spo0J
MLLPISSIAVINRQRKQIDPKKLAELAESIKARGKLLHPIVVREPHESEKEKLAAGQTKVLVVGGRRLAAHIFLGLKEIEVNDFESLDPYEAEICELEENLKRENITWQEEVDARDPESINYISPKTRTTT